MFIVASIVHIFFAILFYILGANLESALFWIGGVLTFFFFAPFRIFWSRESESHADIPSQTRVLQAALGNRIIQFFSQSAIFVAVILFYLALFGAIYGLSDLLHFQIRDFSSWLSILVSLIVGIAAYFHFFQNQTARILGEVNLGIVWILSIVLILFWFERGISFQELLGYWLCVGALFILMWKDEWQISLGRKVGFTICLWMGIYFAWVAGVVFLFDGMSLFSASTSLLLYSIFCFESAASPRLQKTRELIRAVSLFGIYAATILLSVLILWDMSLLTGALLLVSLSFNVYVHTRFENYPSLVFAVVIPIILHAAYIGQPETFLWFFFGSLFLTLGLTYFGRLIRTPHKMDEYIFQTLAVVTLIGSTSIYAWRVWFSGILEFSGLLLLFSVLFFVSYLQIRK